ncbi:MAG: DUF2062 domain-containing protein [Candidatus Babeliaceae bacterium]
MKRRFKNFFNRLLAQQKNPVILAKTFCLGLFIAFSPYLGIQTIIAIVAGWLFKLDIKLLIIILYTVNNPWTMIPIAVLDYLVGQWLLGLFSIDLTPYNPAWMEWMNRKIGPYISQYLGISQLSLWNFIIGGNVVALIISLGLYLLIKRLFIRLKASKKTDSIHENHHTK